MKQVSNNLFYADENKIFQHIESQEIYGNGICLAEDDSINNYKEIDDPNPQPTATPNPTRANRRKKIADDAPEGA